MPGYNQKQSGIQRHRQLEERETKVIEIGPPDIGILRYRLKITTLITFKGK